MRSGARRLDECDREQDGGQPDGHRKDRHECQWKTGDTRGPEENRASDRDTEQCDDAGRGQHDDEGQCRQGPFRAALTDLTVRCAEKPKPDSQRNIGQGTNDRERCSGCLIARWRFGRAHPSIIHTYELRGE